MSRKLIQNLLYVLCVNVAVKAIWIFFIDRNVQLRVGYTDYGSFQALFNLGLVFQIFLDFGLSQSASKSVAAFPSRVSALFASMFWAKLLLSLAYFAIVFLAALALGYRAADLKMLPGILLIHCFSSLVVFLRANIAGMHFFKWDGTLAVVDRLLMILICGCLLAMPQVFGTFKIEWFIVAQAACYCAAFLLGLVVFVKVVRVPLHFSFRFSMIKSVMRQGAPYALLVLLMSVFMRSDSVLIERICADGKHQAGVYAAAFRLLDVSNIFGVMFAGMLLPLFARGIAQKQSVAPTVRLSVDLMMPVAFAVSAGCFFWGNEIMQFLYHGRGGGQEAAVFKVLMFAFPPYCLMYIYSTLLTASGALKQLNVIAAVTAAFNILLHIFFINRFQAQGAAIAVLLTEWGVAAAVILQAHRSFSLPHNKPWLFRHLAVVFCVFAAAYLLHTYFAGGELSGLLLFAGLALVCFVLSGLWRPEAFKNLFKAA